MEGRRGNVKEIWLVVPPLAAGRCLGTNKQGLSVLAAPFRIPFKCMSALAADDLVAWLLSNF